MKRKQSPCKPGPVPLAGCLPFIYSAGYPTALAFYPPSWLAPRTDSPQPMVYANLQPPDGTARRSPAGWRVFCNGESKDYEDEFEKCLEWLKPYIRCGIGVDEMYAMTIGEGQNEPTIYKLYDGNEY